MHKSAGWADLFSFFYAWEGLQTATIFPSYAQDSTLLSISELALDIFSMYTIYLLSMHRRLSTFSITVEKQRHLNLAWFTVPWKADYPTGKVGKKRQDIHRYAQHNLKLPSSRKLLSKTLWKIWHLCCILLLQISHKGISARFTFHLIRLFWIHTSRTMEIMLRLYILMNVWLIIEKVSNYSGRSYIW